MARTPPSPPPSVLPARVPPSLRLAFAMRSGMLRGQAELVHERRDGVYSMDLRGRAIGLDILHLSSRGRVGAHGFEPERYADQRLSRAARVANSRLRNSPAATGPRGRVRPRFWTHPLCRQRGHARPDTGLSGSPDLDAAVVRCARRGAGAAAVGQRTGLPGVGRAQRPGRLAFRRARPRACHARPWGSLAGLAAHAIAPSAP